MVKFLSLLSLVFLSTLMLVPVVHASTPITVTGTNTVTSFTQTSSRSADGNTIITGSFTGVQTGSFVITFTGTQTIIIHPDGSGEVQGTSTASGTVVGRSMTANL
jgi:hypothetical protein